MAQVPTIDYILNMKPVILAVSIVISFSLGITAYLWNQLAVAIAFTIIVPVSLLYLLISKRYKVETPEKSEKKKKSAVDNYFHPMEK